MANFGDNMRPYINTEWRAEDEKIMKVFNEEWEKATKNLVETTPEGQIRFALVNRWKIIRRLRRKLFFRRSHFFIYNTLRRKSRSKPFFASCPDELYFPMFNGLRVHDIMGEKEMVLFYANNIENYPDAGKDLIEFWFESQVLPRFEKLIKEQKTDYAITTDHSKLCFYSEIEKALNHFGITLEQDEYKEIFTNLCNKNGIKLKEFETTLSSIIISL